MQAFQIRCAFYFRSREEAEAWARKCWYPDEALGACGGGVEEVELPDPAPYLSQESMDRLNRISPGLGDFFKAREWGLSVEGIPGASDG